MKILLVEDDRATAALISDALTSCRYILDVTAGSCFSAIHNKFSVEVPLSIADRW